MDLIDLPAFGPDRYQQTVDGESDPFGTDHLGVVWSSCGPGQGHRQALRRLANRPGGILSTCLGRGVLDDELVAWPGGFRDCRLTTSTRGISRLVGCPRSSPWRTRRAAWPRPPPCSRLGVALAQGGKRVLVVDLDPQACLTYSLGFDPDALESSLHDVLVRRAKVADVTRSVPSVDGLALVPATIDLAGRRGAPPGQDRARARPGAGARAGPRRLRPGPDRLPAVARGAHHQRPDGGRRGRDPSAVRGPQPPGRRPAPRDDRRRPDLRQRRPRGPRRGRHHVRRPHPPRPPRARRGGVALRPASSSSPRCPSRSASPRRPSTAAPSSQHAPDSAGADAYRAIAARLGELLVGV